MIFVVAVAGAVGWFDPDGGRTAYVSERSLVKGDFVDKQFKLCEKGERGYVDCFLLPS